MTANKKMKFTEAVPLSLSSMAHMALPLEEGVLDGMKQVIQHTLLSCVNYARATHPPHQWTFRDLRTSPYAWEPLEVKPDHHNNNNNNSNSDTSTMIPPALKKLHFQHQYQRAAFVYLSKPDFEPSKEEERQCLIMHNMQQPAAPDDDNSSGGECNNNNNNNHHWTSQNPHMLAKIRLLFATTALMTPGELQGKERHDDTPKCLLYKVVVEYRSLPPTGNKSAVQAEELSMLSLGGSVDDDVKYGALASLYDPMAKYALEIYSVRGKKYKFDLMDSTLSDGTVPRLPSPAAVAASSQQQQPKNSSKAARLEDADPSDPFVKSLCVTVTDHTTTTTSPTTTTTTTTTTTDNNQSSTNNKNALTRIHLTLEGNLRHPSLLDQAFEKQSGVPPPNFYSQCLQETFLSLNAHPPERVVGMPSGHTLLLDPKEAGKVYVNGRYVTTWGQDPKIGCHFPALFGMDLHSIPYWHGRIFDYDILKRHYAQLWQEILIDARLAQRNIAGRLLSRLINGHDPVKGVDDKDHDDDDDYDDDDDDIDLDADPEQDEKVNNKKKKDDGNGDDNNEGKEEGDDNKEGGGNGDDVDVDDDDDEGGESKREANSAIRINTDVDCLESQVMQSVKFDPVGISAKALATKFQQTYGKEGFPCLAQEMDWVKDRLPGRVPVAVPQRAINVLRRGGYFDTRRTSDEVWFSSSRPPANKTNIPEQTIVQRAVQLLQDAGCRDVTESTIVVFSGEGLNTADPVQKKGLVRFNRNLRQYHVNQYFFVMDLMDDDIDDMDVMPLSSSAAAADGDEDKEKDGGDKEDKEESSESSPDIEARAFLLGTHLAKEHPDGSILIKYLLKHYSQNKKSSKKDDDDDDGDDKDEDNGNDNDDDDKEKEKEEKPSKRKRK